MERGWFPKGSVARPTVGRATRSPFFAFLDNHETWSKTGNNDGIRYKIDALHHSNDFAIEDGIQGIAHGRVGARAAVECIATWSRCVVAL